MAAPLLSPTLPGLRLNLVAHGQRFLELDRLDAYARGTQYDARAFDWDGCMRSSFSDVRINPGYNVPLSRRRPTAQLKMGKVIVGRLTSMTLGSEHWPTVKIDGDEEAEDFAAALIEDSNLAAKMIEARDYGGSCGTSVLSFKFIDGRPRIGVHRAKNITVLRWKDRDDFVVAEAIKAYRYERTVWEEGKPVRRWFYFVRHWDEVSETIWDPIPESEAVSGRWATSVKSTQVEHNFGECPVYWAQNLPDATSEDGLSDFDGQTDEFDAINTLLSATGKGTIANVDPTLVIHDDPKQNAGNIEKGSGTAIFSKGGASYLELKGDAVRTALELMSAVKDFSLDVAGVVLADPDTLASKAQSAAALKMLYLPMINQCDKLRTQYGRLLVRLVVGMLRAARRIGLAEPGEIITTSEGHRMQLRPAVMLPPRIEIVADEVAEAGVEPKQTVRKIERVPGTGENVTLNWPAYFAPTPVDVKADVEAANQASGTLVAENTATAYVARHFGVKDVRKERALILAQQARNAAMAAAEAAEFNKATGDDDEPAFEE